MECPEFVIRINAKLDPKNKLTFSVIEDDKIATEEQVTAYLIEKLNSALHRSLITPEQYGPLKAHMFGSDEGEEVDADYFEVEE